MYLSVFLIFCVMTLAYYLARADGRKGWFWGLTGLLVAAVGTQLISNQILAAVASIVVTFLLMILANTWLPSNKKGAGLKKEKH